METQSNYLSLDLRYYVVAQAEAGFKYDSIIELVKGKYDKVITKGTISKLRSKFRDEGTLKDRPKSGRPWKKSEEDIAMIIEAVEENPKLNASALSRDQNLNPEGQGHLSARHMTRVLNNSGLFDTTSLPQKISQNSMDLRLEFANDSIVKRLDWSRIVFSDESDLFPDRSGKVHYRSYRGERAEVDYGYEPRWDPRKVKVWGTISSQGVGTLRRFEGNLDSNTYKDILNNNLLNDFPLLRGTRTRAGKYLFQQDGAGPHRGNLVKDWFIDNRVYLLNWPSYSPDLNPIENVWGFIKGELFKENTSLTTADETWEEIQDIWYNRLNPMIEKLYDSLPNRMQRVIDLNGARIS